MAILYLPIPRPWHDRLKVLASENATSVSGVVRILLREALFGKQDAA